MAASTPAPRAPGRVPYLCLQTVLLHRVALLLCDPHAGHILPGAVFILWGCYWAYHACIYHVWVSPRRPYRARAWYPLPLPLCRLAEPILKLVVPLVAVSMELYFDHPDGYRYLYCPAGTRHANRFALTHVNNWQHAAVYPAFLLAGAVDLLSHWVALPPGSSHAVLAVAYAVMAFLMGTHEKHEPQDKVGVFCLLACCCMSRFNTRGL